MGRKTECSHLLDVVYATVGVRMGSELERLWTCEHDPGLGVSAIRAASIRIRPFVHLVR